MNWYRADMHIHTVLSPCGDLDMSPVKIIEQAKSKKLDIIAITDHNSTRHCKLAMDLGKRENITVIPGVEFNSSEEVHCLGWFEDEETIDEVQKFLESVKPDLKNKSALFGEQLVVNEHEEIIDEEECLLIESLKSSINEIEKFVHQKGGLFLPAHIDRAYNSILSQLGFIPKGLVIDGVEISSNVPVKNTTTRNLEIGALRVRNSDAHYLEQIGRSVTCFEMREPSFSELKSLLKSGDEKRIKYEC